jgi:diguanylate cyclase (GGDEF)-like protein/PAS domain S-box-containing protein
VSLRHNGNGTQGTFGEGEERARFQARLLDAMGQAVIATDLQGKVIYWNRAAEELYGWSQEEVMGRPITEITPSGEMLGRADEIMSGLLGGRSWSGEFEVRRKDGTTFPVMVTDTPVHDERGNLVAILGVSTDITERRMAEEACKDSEQRYRAVIEQTTEGIYLGAADTKRVMECNAAFQKMLGYSAQELRGMHIHDFVAHDQESIDSVFRGVLDSGHAFIRERKYRRKDGSVVDVEANATVISYQEREVVCTVVRDVTERKVAEEALKESEERSRSSFRDAAIGMALVGTDGRWLQVNRFLCQMLGYAEEELLSRTFKDISHPDDLDVSVSRVGELLEGKREGYQLEKRYLHADGHPVWAALSVSAVRDPVGNPLYLISQMQDITERKEAEEKIEEAEERYRTLVERIPVVTYIQELSPFGRTIYISPQYESIKGYSREEALSEPNHWLRILHPDDRERVLAEDERTDRTGEPFVAEYRQIAKDGSVVCVRDEATLVHNEKGEPLYWLGIQTDVTERKVLEERLEHQALHDSLTDLPNRSLFLDRLGHALSHIGRKKGCRVAVLYMDLNNFKSVNDSLGHEVGDGLLVAMAERLKGCMRPEDTLARIGGDEFVVLLEDAQNPDEPVRVAQRIIDVLTNPFLLDGKELYARASIGIAMGGDRTKEPGDLLRDADTAMYWAKDEGSGYKVFDPAMHERAIGRLEAENDLRRAIEREEFVVHYQPIVSLHSGEPFAFEALVRWDHPERGLLNPDEFVPLAEESGLVVPMGEQVLREACLRARQWQAEHPRLPPLMMCVNLSARQLTRPDLAEMVEGILKETGLEGGCLTLDVTETVYVRALEGNTMDLDRLRSMEVRISIDDFGTGYSSLSYLKRLPADAIKIDKSFVRGLGEDIGDTAIVRTVVELAHTFGMEAIAEGVETEEQAELLREMGCDFAQGFHLSKPLPPDDVSRLLADNLSRPSLLGDSHGESRDLDDVASKVLISKQIRDTPKQATG